MGLDATSVEGAVQRGRFIELTLIGGLFQIHPALGHVSQSKAAKSFSESRAEAPAFDDTRGFVNHFENAVARSSFELKQPRRVQQRYRLKPGFHLAKLCFGP